MKQVFKGTYFYASVNEQSGIKAGDGGFQVNVNGNANLTGAVIASADKAIQNNLNSLTTQTLTTSNIANKADYKSSSSSIGSGYSTSGDGVGLSQDGKAQTGGAKVPGTTLPSLGGFSASLPVAMDASGNGNSTTVSGISGSTINITNNQAQQALTGKDSATTVAMLNQDVKVVQSTDANGNITTATVDNGPSFRVDIDSSRSKGINNMQIFCFDLMLIELACRHGLGPGFLVHDSHLFDGVDERQVAKAIQLGAQKAEKIGFQYIITMNSDVIPKEGFDHQFNVKDFILPVQLTDAIDTGGLFGLHFN